MAAYIAVEWVFTTLLCRSTTGRRFVSSGSEAVMRVINHNRLPWRVIPVPPPAY
jgi:hypothetical protein